MTRHNAGVMFVDKLSESLDSDYGFRRKKDIMVFETKEIVLVKSANIFMNESGRMIRDFFSTSPLTPLQSLREGNLYVAHDDLDIKLGEYKIQLGKGPKEHGGINSIEGVLHSNEFWRVRIGIESRRVEEHESVSGEQFVLQKFTNEEKGIVDKVIEEAVKEIFK